MEPKKSPPPKKKIPMTDLPPFYNPSTASEMLKKNQDGICLEGSPPQGEGAENVTAANWSGACGAAASQENGARACVAQCMDRRRRVAR